MPLREIRRVGSIQFRAPHCLGDVYNPVIDRLNGGERDLLEVQAPSAPVNATTLLLLLRRDICEIVCIVFWVLLVLIGVRRARSMPVYWDGVGVEDVGCRPRVCGVRVRSRVKVIRVRVRVVGVRIRRMRMCYLRMCRLWMCRMGRSWAWISWAWKCGRRVRRAWRRRLRVWGSR